MKKVLQLELEYAAFMVSIVLVRHIVTPENCSFQWSARALAIQLNKESGGKNPNFFLEATALHHGLFSFSKALEIFGITMIPMYSKNVSLLDEFFNLPSRMRGYEMIFNTPTDGMPSSESDTDDAALDRIVSTRDRILLICKYEPSKYTCASAIFAELVMATHDGFPSPPPQLHPTSSRCSSSLGKRQLINIKKQIVDDVSNYYGASNVLFYLEGALETAKKKEKLNDGDQVGSTAGDDALDVVRNIENEIVAEEEREACGSDEESDDNEEIVAVLNTIRSRKVTFTAEEIADVLKVYDAVKKKHIDNKSVWTDLTVCQKTKSLLLRKGGFTDLETRTISRWNKRRSVNFAKRGRKVDTDFEAEIWANLTICYLEEPDEVRNNTSLQCNEFIRLTHFKIEYCRKCLKGLKQRWL